MDKPKLVDEIVCEVKAQGVFDQFRRNCLADVDANVAFKNLGQRVENIVTNFLSCQAWSPGLKKKRLRKRLRKFVSKAGFLKTFVKRIVDQEVNSKMNSIFTSKIEDITINYLGIRKPKPSTHQRRLIPQDLVNSEANCEQPIPIPKPQVKASTQSNVIQSQQVILENINQVSSNSHISIVFHSNNKSSEVDICEVVQVPKVSKTLFKDQDRNVDGRNNDGTFIEDVVMKELEEPADSVDDESLNNTETSSSCMDPIISKTKDLYHKDDGRCNENNEPVMSTDASVGAGCSHNASDTHKTKDLKRILILDISSDRKSHRKDKFNHHEDGKHSSLSNSKHSSILLSSWKEHRKRKREGIKATSSDRKRAESKPIILSGKSQSSAHLLSRDEDSSYKSSCSHENELSSADEELRLANQLLDNIKNYRNWLRESRMPSNGLYPPNPFKGSLIPEGLCNVPDTKLATQFKKPINDCLSGGGACTKMITLKSSKKENVPPCTMFKKQKNCASHFAEILD